MRHATNFAGAALPELAIRNDLGGVRSADIFLHQVRSLSVAFEETLRLTNDIAPPSDRMPT